MLLINEIVSFNSQEVLFQKFLLKVATFNICEERKQIIDKNI